MLFCDKCFSVHRKLRGVLQQRLIKFFIDQSKKHAEKYAKFFEDYGLFMREGIVTTAEQEVKVGSGFLGLSLGCLGLWRKLLEIRNLSFPGRDDGIARHPSHHSQGSESAAFGLWTPQVVPAGPACTCTCPAPPVPSFEGSGHLVSLPPRAWGAWGGHRSQDRRGAWFTGWGGQVRYM